MLEYLSDALALMALGASVYLLRAAAAARDGWQRLSAPLRADLAKMREQLANDLDEGRRDWKKIADECEELLDRARTERARMDGRRGGGRPRGPDPQEDPTGNWGPEEYRRHLERGGRPIPSVEGRLGIA